MSKFIMPNLQKEAIENLLNKEGTRLDGRKADEYRELYVEDGISKNSASAVRVRLERLRFWLVFIWLWQLLILIHRTKGLL